MATHGIQILVDPPEAIIDMVFVHGLTGGRESTWTETKSKVFWPKDLLHHEIPNARIMTFGYDADIVNILTPASSNNIRNHGQALAHELGLKRKRSKTDARPLVFIAHSLGGLVCEQALLISRGAAEKHLNDILESTSAIAFMGTPHAGSDLANWAKILTGLSSVLKRTNKEIVNVLRPGSEVLANLQQEFHTMLQARQLKSQTTPPKIFCFFEELPVSGTGEIVPKHSAILTAYGNRGIHANHMDMTKFKSREDAGFVAVSDQLWLWTNEIEESATQSRPAVPSTDTDIADVRATRIRRFGTADDTSSERVSVFSSAIDSGGGSVFQGNPSTTGNFTLNM